MSIRLPKKPRSMWNPLNWISHEEINASLITRITVQSQMIQFCFKISSDQCKFPHSSTTSLFQYEVFSNTTTV
ncbi:hypothetical protein NPIL_330271 [Nephila pilipes]|uniref:Uncharacterized protein n=1 Tax=Nephila pilipes TaxID=299642 RepID=A0A8X6UIM3_NEPPI|nr:hypothetical protein NPIL_330271 [Nephila pilipes]